MYVCMYVYSTLSTLSQTNTINKMLTSQPHFSTTVLRPLNHRPPPKTTTLNLSSSHNQNDDVPNTTHNRTHNAKSTSLLLKPQENQNPLPKTQENYQETFFTPTKRVPQFPGSIRIESFNSFNNADEVDDEMLVRALEVRRKVTVGILKEALERGKFGITYCENLVGCLSGFVDFVMIKAVSMKGFGEFDRLSFNARVKVFIDECGVVPLVRWLKHNSLSYPQIGKLICASRGDLDSIRRLANWLKSIHVKGRFIGVALTRSAEEVFERGIEELDEIIGYLEDNGVRSDWMGYVVSRCPEILSFSIEEVRCRTEFYLSMGMDKNDFGTMLFDCPKVFGYLSLEQMNEKVDYLIEFGIGREDVGRLLAFKPQLMACSIEDRWKPLVKYFYYLGISKDGMRRILTMKPIIFCIDLESNIAPKVQFLRDIGVQEDAIGNILVKFPSLLTQSLYKKIRPVVIFLLTKAGVSQKDVGKVIALCPELLGCSIGNKLDHNVKYLLSLGISLPQVGEMISDFPMLLRYNIDVLRPKYRYLRRTMIRPLQDLIEFPRFFSYSLEERITPRHKVMVENRINFKLRYMLASSDDEFDARVKDAVERRRKFESGIICDDLLLDHQNGDIKSQTLDNFVDST